MSALVQSTRAPVLGRHGEHDRNRRARAGRRLSRATRGSAPDLRPAEAAARAGRLPRSRGPADELLDVYRDNVHAVLVFFSCSLSHDTAEDLTAATFERVVKSWSRFNPETASPRTWILAIARNVLTDHFRRESHRHAISLDEHPTLASSLASGDDPTARLQSVDMVRHWLGSLERREREVLALRFGADLPASQVARHLELTEANVHQIAARALRRLQARATPGRPRAHSLSLAAPAVSGTAGGSSAGQ